MKIVGWLFTLLIIIIGVAFAALNARSIEVNYFFGSKAFPLVVLLFISLAMGVLLSALIMGWRILRLKTQNVSLQRKLKHTQEELAHAQHK